MEEDSSLRTIQQLFVTKFLNQSQVIVDLKRLKMKLKNWFIVKEFYSVCELFE